MTLPRSLTAALALLALTGLSACGGVTGATTSSKDHLTVLELGATYGTWTSLDPLTNPSAGINHDLMNAVYGRLFRRGADGRVAPDLAAGDQVSPDGREVRITLRPGVRFSDGSPLDAAAVVFNLRRDLARAGACSCRQNFAAVSSVSAATSATVVLHLARRDPSILQAFIDAPPNWIVSPTALRKLGQAAFGLRPVGAGPFVVSRNVLSSRLDLAANPAYRRAGRPRLKRLTFLSIANDQSAYAALRTGQAQIYMNFGTPALLGQMRRRFRVVPQPATQTEAVNLDPETVPFDDHRAREAIYYATDPQAINEHLFGGAGRLSQAPGGPGDLFWNPTVAGYRTYAPERARALVRQLGGLSFTLTTIATPIQVPLAEALQSQWRAAGMDVRLAVLTIPQAVEETEKGRTQALSTLVGSYDPSLLPGIGASYSSTGPFSLVRDPALDRLIDAAKAEPGRAATNRRYQGISTYLSRQAYAPYLFTAPAWNVVAPHVTGVVPNAPDVDWEDVGWTS
jgi:peptide/nickel transport system substrate-binding protein